MSPFVRTALASALLVTALACGGSSSTVVSTTEPDASTSGVSVTASANDSSATVTTNGTGTAAAPAANTANTANKEYAGTYLGVCERMADCSCPVSNTPKACAITLETSMKQGQQLAATMGINVPAPNQATLYAASNSTCAIICEQVRQQYAGGAAAGGMGSFTGSSHVSGGGATINQGAQVGPNGISAGSHVTDDDGLDVRTNVKVGPNGISLEIEDNTVDDW